MRSFLAAVSKDDQLKATKNEFSANVKDNFKKYGIILTQCLKAVSQANPCKITNTPGAYNIEVT